MLLYRKASPLRTRRLTAPEAPFWYASAVLPYGARRGRPVDIDYLTLRASATDRTDVPVCTNVKDELERARGLTSPVLIETSGAAERVFRRGDELLAFCESRDLAAIQLVSADGALPARPYAETVTAISAWPFDAARVTRLFREAEEKQLRWGVVVPVLYPVTTQLDALAELADRAAACGARFLAPIAVDVDPTARQAFASLLGLSTDDDRYAMLFHADLAPLHLATERHIAALAAERNLKDFVEPPGWSERSNWNAAVLLTIVASRMMAMEVDLDLAGTIARTARTVATLDKPLSRVAEAASLAIIEALDDTSVPILTEWLDAAEPSFAGWVNEQWRVRRDSGV